MGKFNVKLDGIEELESELQRLNSVRFEAVVEKQTVQMLNRARQPGGTPVDTGELRMSSMATNDEVGYTKDYAPHVEYGHRTANGGYVEGQHFLESNVEQQRKIYRSDLKDAIEKEGG